MKIFYHGFFSHKYFQPLTFPKLWYLVIPWKEDKLQLPNNFIVALHGLQNLERRLWKCSQDAVVYSRVMAFFQGIFQLPCYKLLRTTCGHLNNLLSKFCRLCNATIWVTAIYLLQEKLSLLKKSQLTNGIYHHTL